MMTWNSFMFLFPASVAMEMIYFMHDFLMMILFSILFFSLLILFYSLSSKFFSLNFFEDHQVEIIWTIVPFILLFFIILPSLLTLYMLDSCVFCGFTVSVMGHQWYWSYFYKNLFDNFSLDSFMLPREEGCIRLLDVDNRLILPSSVPVRILVSSSDVIHSWSLPSLGVKMDALPGRINQFCFSAKRSGIFFGQCSEICGANHSFMPIVLEVIPVKKFLSFVS